MSIEKLKQALLRKAKEEVEKYHKNAYKELSKFREEKFDELESYKANYRRNVTKELKKKKENILAEANRRAQRMVFLTEHKLAERIYNLSINELEFLRDANYEAAFAKLVQELPKNCWEEVTVNEKDVTLAQKFFPDAKVKAVSDIRGGFIVSANREKVAIVNSFEKRLEKAFPEILTTLLKEVYESIGNKKR